MQVTRSIEEKMTITEEREIDKDDEKKRVSSTSLHDY